MGFWSLHPLDCDEAIEAITKLDEMIFVQEKIEKNFNQDEKEYKKHLCNFLKGFVKRNLEKNKNVLEDELKSMAFIVPFLIVKYEIIIDDFGLSQDIKKLIKDGGAKMRMSTVFSIEDYALPEPGDIQYPTEINGWNGFTDTFDYAVHLKNKWDDLMEGEYDFSLLKPNKKLIKAFL